MTDSLTRAMPYAGILARMVELLEQHEDMTLGAAYEQAKTTEGIEEVPFDIEHSIMTAAYKMMRTGFQTKVDA